MGRDKSRTPQEERKKKEQEAAAKQSGAKDERQGKGREGVWIFPRRKTNRMI